MKMHSGLLIGFATIFCLGASPVLAQSVTNSNFGGVTNSNPQGVSSFGSPGSAGSTGYNATVLDQAKALQQQLADAQSVQACTGVRSFLRTPQTCPTNDRLIKAKADAAAFLESVRNPGSNLLAETTTAVAKSNPTW